MVKHGWTLCDTLFLSLCKFWISSCVDEISWWWWWRETMQSLDCTTILCWQQCHSIQSLFVFVRETSHTTHHVPTHGSGAMPSQYVTNLDKTNHVGIFSHPFTGEFDPSTHWCGPNFGPSNNVKYLQKNYASVGSVDELSNAKPNMTNSTSTIKWCVWGSLNSTRLNPT